MDKNTDKYMATGLHRGLPTWDFAVWFFRLTVGASHCALDVCCVSSGLEAVVPGAAHGTPFPPLPMFLHPKRLHNPSSVSFSILLSI